MIYRMSLMCAAAVVVLVVESVDMVASTLMTAT